MSQPYLGGAWRAAMLLLMLGLAAGCGSSHHSTSMTMSGSTSGGSMMPTPEHAMLMIKPSHYGTVLFDSHGKVLYLFEADKGSTSTCYGTCATAWPPVLTKSQPQVAAGLNAALLGTTKRTDASLQVTYNGHPLYTYSGDKPGKIMCQNANMHGGVWLIVSPNGKPVMKGGSM